MPQLRLIRDSNFWNGSRNMATDCAILEGVSAGRQPPTLRLYGWDPMCLSVGYGQRLRDVDRQRLQARGWQLVRRPTGGKAILHGDELTYCLCLPIAHSLANGDILSSYQRISAGLAAGLECLGLMVSSGPKGAGLNNNSPGPVCFEIASHYEITVSGRKLVGSAQMRRKAGILQHGTIPIRGDVGRICDVLTFRSEDERDSLRQSVRKRAVTLEALMESAPSWDKVADAFVAGFEQAFGFDILRQELSCDELYRARTLMEEQFANPDWTSKR